MYSGVVYATSRLCYKPTKGVADVRDIFPRIYGNGTTKARIGTAVQTGTLPHAFLIDGERGSGKMTLALEIAAALNCENKDSATHTLPCYSCSNCKRILGGGHVDVHVMGLADGRATIGVNEIKELRADMFLSSTESDYKIYIVRDAERMTPEAQNALLIVLEEPPRNVVIMLLASGTDKILTTIKSRAQYIAMSRFSPEEIAEYLTASDDDAARVARSDKEGFTLAVASACGSIGRAKELLTPGRREAIAEERQETVDIVRLFDRNAPYSELYRAVMELPKKRPELSDSLERLITATRDLIAIRYDEDAPLSFFYDRAQARSLAMATDTARLFKIYDIITSAHEDNYKNANITALLSLLAAGIKTA